MWIKESYATLQKTIGTQFAVSRLSGSPETEMVSVPPFAPPAEEPLEQAETPDANATTPASTDAARRRVILTDIDTSV
jgi:hypothetical protein